jgi:hypothetical protein
MPFGLLWLAFKFVDFHSCGVNDPDDFDRVPNRNPRQKCSALGSFILYLDGHWRCSKALPYPPDPEDRWFRGN